MRKTRTLQNQIFVHPETEEAFIEILEPYFHSIAYGNPSVVRHNLELGCPGGMSREDRSISMELGDFFIDNVSMIFIGLIVNDTFREAIKRAVCVEIALDDLSKDEIAGFRKEMKLGKGRPQKPSKGNYVADFSIFDCEFFMHLTGRLADSFKMFKEYYGVVDDAMMELTEDDRLDNGFIVSNFMYLYRAVAQNEVFANYLRSVITDVKKEWNIIGPSSEIDTPQA